MEGKVFLCQSLIWAMILLGQIHGYKSCIVKERKALLELKTYMGSPTTWTNDTKSDCCQWEKVECNSTTGRVIKLSIYLYNSRKNPFLNLSLLHPFEDLQSLDLSGAGFVGLFDDVLGYKSLQRLRNLDLSSNHFNHSIFPFLKDMRKLEALDLSENEFSGSMELQALCELKNLRELDLSENYLGGQLPPCLGSLNKLQVLDLSSNKISEDLPSSFSGLKSLEYLSLSDNNFTGVFSLKPLANLTKLKVLKLSSTSDMIQVETESTWQPKFQLSVVVLPSCNLEKIPNFLTYQKKLRLVDLSNNRLSRHIPVWLLENNPDLEVLQLNNNLFTIFDHMPTTFAHKLRVLDFSANNIDGPLPDNIGHALPNLLGMNGSRNVLQGAIPSSMGEMKNISDLDLSYNNLTGELPRSFVMGCFSLQFLKLSHNKLSGSFLPRQTNLTSLKMLRVDNNLITGKIGAGLRSSVGLILLDMSNNRLTGGIPSWVSNFTQMNFLKISDNFLQGAIPLSLLLSWSIFFLDLSGNLLSGALPSDFHRPDYFKRYLFLDNNNLTGPIHSTLLEELTMLDLRNNKLSGSIPQFVNAYDIEALLLRGNTLTGSIPNHLCDLSSIRLLDLSDNKLSGSIPSCLNNLSFGFGVKKQEMYASYSWVVDGFSLNFYKSKLVSMEFKIENHMRLDIEIQFATKQRYDSYKGGSEISDGTLDLMYGLDLSINELSGVIPTELGDLSKLRVMNLSHNVLTSSIPNSFSKLKDIESLDLSSNMLHGRIPQQLTNLTSLSSFNVSYNNLSGIIPQGKQFDTFSENSYFGNSGLCGKPTNNISCGAKKIPEEADNDGGGEEDEAFMDMLAFYWSTGSTFVIALIACLVLMSFNCSWCRAWLRLVDAFISSAKSLVS